MARSPLTTTLLVIALCLSAHPSLSAGDKMFRKLFLENTLTSAASVSRIPVRYVKGLIVAPVVVDGDTCNFIFDTGAMICALSDVRAKGKRVLAKMPVASLDGAKAERNIHKADFSVGGQNFLNTGCFAADFTRLSEQLCLRIDGIIGANAIRLANWQLRPQDSMLICSVAPFPATPTAKLVRYELYNGLLPLLQVHLGRDSFWTMLDCGYSGILQLHDSAFFKSGYAPKSPLIKGSGASGLSVNGMIRESLHATRLDGIRIGDLQLDGVETMISSEKPMLGARFLQRFNTSINTTASTIAFETLHDFPDGADAVAPARFCFNPETGLTVCFIWDAAGETGPALRQGDRIVSIDDVNTRNLDAGQWCALRASVIENPAVTEFRVQAESSEKPVVLRKVNLFR